MSNNDQNTINVNEWELKDLLANKDSLNESLTHVVTVASMVSEDSSDDQLRAVLEVVKTTLCDIRTVMYNDRDRLAELVNEPVNKDFDLI